MKKLFWLIAYCLLPIACIAQTMTTVTASSIQQGGVPLASGRVCFQGTDGNNNPIPFRWLGGGQQGLYPFCATVTNGAIVGTFQVPNPQYTIPFNIPYTVRVQDASGNPVFTYLSVQFVGTTFNLDTYVPSNPAPIGNSANYFSFGTGSLTNYLDINCTPSPSNPISPFVRIYCNNATTQLTCLTSGGANCNGGATLETNGTNNASQSVLNVQNGTGTTASNPSGGNVQINVAAAGVTNAMLHDTYSGVGACAAHQWASTLNGDAAPTCTQPGYSDISGTPPPGGLNVQNVPFYASGYRALTTTTAAVSANSLTIPVVSTNGLSTGQVVMIALAGSTSGSTISNFCGLISSLTANQITLSATALTGASLMPQCTSAATGTQTATPASGYTVLSLASTQTSGAVALNGTSIPVSNASSYSANQGIFISGGAASGDLVTTIVSVNGNTITIASPGIQNASGIASGTNVQHDDTNAFQAAIYQASVNSGATVNGYSPNGLGSTISLPDGVYQINGPAQDPSGANAALVMPKILYFSGGVISTGIWFPMVTVSFQGVSAAPQTQNYLTNNTMVSWSGSVVFTSNTTIPNLIGGYDSASFANFTNVKLSLKNIQFRAYQNTGMTLLNASAIAQLEMEHDSFDTTSTNYNNPNGQLSNQGKAIGFPASGNAGNAFGNDLEIAGWYTGAIMGEHAVLMDSRFDADVIPIRPEAGGINPYGQTVIGVEFNGCYHGIYHGSGDGYSSINAYNINVEHNGGNADDVFDGGVGGNNLYGLVTSDVALVTSPSPMPYVKVISNYTYAQMVLGDGTETSGVLAKWAGNGTLTAGLPSDIRASSVGTLATLLGSSNTFVCTAACSVQVMTPPVTPFGGKRLIIGDDNVTAVLTVAPPSGVQLEATARTSYCTAGQALVSGSAVGNLLSLVSRDATHWLVDRSSGTWTCTTITPFDPMSTFGTNLLRWYRADTTNCNLTNGCSIARFTDLSLNGDATYTSGTQPTLVTGAVNSQPAANVGTANATFTIGGSAVSPTSFTAFAVVKIADTSVTRTLFANSVNNGGPELRIDSSTGKLELLSQGTASIATSTSAVTTAAYEKIAVTYNSSTGAWAFYLASDTADSSGTNARSFTQPINDLFNEGGGNFFRDNLVELIIVNGVATAGQVTDIMGNTSGYFKLLYGI